MNVWKAVRIVIVFSLHRSTAVRPVADLIDLEPDVPNAEPNLTRVAGPNASRMAGPNATRVAEPNVSLVAEPNVSRVPGPNVTAQQDDQVEEGCDRTWGDTFEATKGILLPLDYLWLGLSVLLVVGILLWMPKELRIDGDGADSLKNTVGFAGFQKILVARILMTGDPCASFSTSDALLLATLALSVFAMTASCVFLYVDYMRRLAIETALQKGTQLILTPKVLESTGLGRAILLFGGLTLFLYVLQIIKEVVWATAPQEGEEASRWYLQVLQALPRTAGACATVALFYANLRGLHRSPKVPFDSTCQVAEDKTHKTLEEFLRDLSDGAPSLPDWATNGLRKVGGEDLALIATHGSRQAFFPNRRHSPLVHALFGILFIGVCPLAIQIGSQKLFFVSPKLDDLKELTGTTAEVSEKVNTSMWQVMRMSEESTRRREFLLLPRSKLGHLQVSFDYGHTSRVQLCCGHCQAKILKHSLTKLPSKPVTFEFLTNVTNCSLELFGLSNGFVTNVSLIVVPKDDHKFCDCSGDRCNCCEKFQGHWDFAEWNSNTFAKLRNGTCIPINSCPDHEDITDQGDCVEATCDVVNSNQKPGLNCSCKNGFSGNITWKRAIPRGSCVPAECNVTHSNQLPGKKCRCLKDYSGTIEWNGSMALGSCEPRKCVGDRLNGKPGPDCRCKDGYKGEPYLDGDIFRDFYCSLAKCGIPNSRGRGPGCNCTEHHTGTIRWEGPTPSGMCKRMRCVGEHSNGLTGPDCGCKIGFRGPVKPTYVELEQVLFVNCTPAPCQMQSASNGIPGPECGCKNGYAGSRRWNAELKVYTGECLGAACNIGHSNRKPGPDCQCKSGYTGHITWFGQRASGECVPMPCVGENTNGVQGPGCKCRDGFTGSVVEANHTERIEDEWEDEGWSEKTYEAMVGDCRPAPCNVENSNIAPGLDCRCSDGYTGKLTWVGAKVFGECTVLPCVGENMNRIPGPRCRCLDGFRGSLRVTNVSFSGPHPSLWDMPERQSEAQTADCEPAPCNVENSNQVPGLSCQCLDGFTGSITWSEDAAAGSCEPSPCRIENSNKQDGLECRCLDGYNGKITWEGPVPSGTCTAVPCKVPHSDFAAGPDCQCLPGFYGQISWMGTQPEGECLPLPLCSENVVHTTWLNADVKDFDDKECAAGQQLVFHGHLCEEMEGKIAWTSVSAQPPGRCTWHWQVEENCGQDFDNISELLSQVSPPVPMQCSEQAARPRCDAEVNYTTTSLVASQYTCENETDEVDSLRFPKWVQFRGRPCGYDLIWWEAATILNHPEHLTSQALACKIKNQDHQPLECGEIPPAEHLPRGCFRAREPAVFTIEHRSEKQSNGSEQLWSAVYFVKLLDSGMSAMGRLSHSGVATSLHWCSDHAWQTDGKYIYFEVTEEFQDEFDELRFMGIRAADDKVGSGFAGPSGKLRLVARNALPSWWVSKFEDVTKPRDFNADAMMGCRLSAFQNGTCYRTFIGQSVEIFKAEEIVCLGDVDVAESGPWYRYMFSESGIQRYSSDTSCLPRANHHELQLEIEHVGLEAGSQATVVAMETPCRTNLRFVVNVAKLKCKESTLGHAWNLQLIASQRAR
eukprot:s2119_g4.t5